MSFSFGSKFRITFFGESHGDGIGVVIDGIPAGSAIDLALIRSDLRRRNPEDELGTPRKEKDELKILSGLFNGRTNGGPLTIYLENLDIKPSDYDRTIPRPSHADYPAYVKYRGYNDYRGGGFFSGRLTALMSIAGSVAKQLLSATQICVGTQVMQVGDIKDERIIFNQENILKLKNKKYPMAAKEEEMLELVRETKQRGDSVGGLVACHVLNVPVGIGQPYFRSFESQLSSLLFSIPAVKSVEFGLGNDFASSYGSQVNDQYYLEGEEVRTFSNFNGGILGGITTGEPIEVRVAFKPTPTIANAQNSVDMVNLKEVTIEGRGRHDCCIALRGHAVVEAAMWIVLADFILEDA